MAQKSAVSALVLNFNGADRLQLCLESVFSQTSKPAEVVVVDNASSDGSINAASARFPDAKIIRSDSNLGYCAGMNLGFTHCTSPYIATINFDVVLDSGYLEQCAEALADDPGLGGVTGKLLRPDRKLIDTTGHLIYRNRRAVDRGELEIDSGQYDQSTEVFSISGAAAVYRKSMLDDIAVDEMVFDEDFFAYFEDVDLCWRAQLRGWRFAFVAEALAVHDRGSAGGKQHTFILACNHRNRWLVMLRNDSPAAFARHLPGIVYTEIRATAHMLALRPAAIPAAWEQFLKLFPTQVKRRRLIQRRRIADARALEHWFAPYRYGPLSTIKRLRRRRAGRAQGSSQPE